MYLLCNQTSTCFYVYITRASLARLRLTQLSHLPELLKWAVLTTHRLAYGHESGIVLIDIIQKCVIINATLSDLYGGSLPNSNNRDISIQPYATSSILQHHYQAASSSNGGVFGSGSDFGNLGGTNNQVPPLDNCTAAGHHQQQPHNRTDLSGNERTASTGINKSVVAGVDGGQVSYRTIPTLPTRFCFALKSA